MLRKPTFLALCFFLLVGCAGMLFGAKYQYTYMLVKPDSTADMIWEDSTISIAFAISQKTVDFRLQNKANEVIKLIWDEATIVQYGEAQKVMHAGVKYTDRNQSQPPTTIPPGASIEDLILPTDNVYWSEGYGSVAGGWEEHDLFPTSDMNKPEFKSAILNSKGQRFSIYLPIQRQGKTIDYTFEFMIAGVTPIARR